MAIPCVGRRPDARSLSDRVIFACYTGVTLWRTPGEEMRRHSPATPPGARVRGKGESPAVDLPDARIHEMASARPGTTPTGKARLHFRCRPAGTSLPLRRPYPADGLAGENTSQRALAPTF
jgi:hypothetical protein